MPESGVVLPRIRVVIERGTCLERRQDVASFADSAGTPVHTLKPVEL